ncbi:MAG: discoidin domain-containing protein, partial [Planctomycetes bacterium]|nr:discoidin domain-containing protein [Planctomycetota bacterium]
MSKKLMRLACLVLVMSVARNASAELIAHWRFDEGSGDIAIDISGNGNDGTINGAQSVPGVGGSALAFDGVDDYVETPLLDVPEDGTVEAWVNTSVSDVRQAVISSHNGEEFRLHLNYRPGTGGATPGFLGLNVLFGSLAASTDIGSEMYDGSWHHVAFVWEGASATIRAYWDGQEKPLTYAGQNVWEGNYNRSAVHVIGREDLNNNNYFFAGQIDDVRMYDHALSEIEILTDMKMAPELASNPNPVEDAIDVPRNVAIDWVPGDFAVKHDVYFGTTFGDVNAASVANPLDVLASQGQDASTFDPGRLDFGQTYFWRVDEVNGAPDFTVYGGNIWSFTVEPFSIPINNVTATASSQFGASGPEKTIDGSGLVDDLHGVDAAEMWISAGVPATIEYAFDRAYKLHELWIWNSNQLIEAFVGFGAKDVVIEHSLDGENWTVLDGVGPLAQATGTEGYAHNNTINFGGAVAQHVRLTINSVQGIAPQASLSEVRFFSIPTLATRPSPVSGATDVSPDVPLAWGRDGREAGSHEVYVGTDPDNLPLAGSVSESSFDTSAVDLQLSQTYFWRVDEVNEALDPSTWTGDVWSFTTADAIVIDDMESYKDEEFLEIWATWVDGFGDEANNGALVGANPGIGDFSPESTIVHGDNQSLPIHYDNSAAAQSEATRIVAISQDWTRAGVTTLVVWFHGAAGNSGQLYLKVNGTKIPYDGPAGNIALAAWQPWNIDLASLGMNLQSVRSLTVGIEGNGATGTLYVDDITLT